MRKERVHRGQDKTYVFSSTARDVRRKGLYFASDVDARKVDVDQDWVTGGVGPEDYCLFGSVDSAVSGRESDVQGGSQCEGQSYEEGGCG